MSKWGYLLETDAEYRKLYRRWLETGSNDHDSILYSRVEKAWLNSADGAQTHFDNDVKKLRQAAPSIGTSVTNTYENVMRSFFYWIGGVSFDIPDGLNRASHILLYYPPLPSIYVSLPYIYVAPGLDYALNSKLIPLLRHLFPGRRFED